MMTITTTTRVVAIPMPNKTAVETEGYQLYQAGQIMNSG